MGPIVFFWLTTLHRRGDGNLSLFLCFSRCIWKAPDSLRLLCFHLDFSITSISAGDKNQAEGETPSLDQGHVPALCPHPFSSTAVDGITVVITTVTMATQGQYPSDCGKTSILTQRKEHFSTFGAGIHRKNIILQGKGV